MKKNLILLLGILLLTVFSSMAQTKISTKKNSSGNTVTNYGLPYDKNKWLFSIATENLGYSYTSGKSNGNNLGKQSNLLLSLGVHYFFIKSLAAGLELETRSRNAKYDDSKEKASSWMAYVNLTYQTSIAKNFGFLARAGVGTGSSIAKYTNYSPSYTNKEKYNEFGYKFHVGFPIGIDGNGPSYLTPLFTYQHLHNKFDDGTNTGNYFIFSLGLQSYLSGKQTSCDGHSGHSISNNLYNQGSSYIGITTDAVVSFGSTKTRYDSYPGDDHKQSSSQQQVNAGYMFYVLNNLAVGADLNFQHNHSKNNGSDNQWTSTLTSITPMIEFNMPVKNSSLHNLSLRAGVGFGSRRYEADNGFLTDVDKYSVFRYCIGAAYNIPFTPKLALKWGVEYESLKIKNKDTNVSETYNGPEAIVGVVKFF